MGNISVSDEARFAFRDWLRERLRGLEFYNRRGDHYLIREFHKYCAEHGQEIDEASLGRYLRDEDPVIPTPDRCRALAAVFKIPPIEVMKAAGLVIEADFAVQ
ncbi:MAG TPA: hypothetical protein VGF38_24140 [Ktedonobacterales bacterium]